METEKNQPIRKIGNYSLEIKEPGSLVIDFKTGNSIRVEHGETVTGRNKRTGEITFYMTQKTYDIMNAKISKDVDDFKKRMQKQKESEAKNAETSS